MDITHVEVLHDHVVALRFADGTAKTVDLDLDPYLHGPVFVAIRDNPAVFASGKVDPAASTIGLAQYAGRRSARMESEARAS